MLAYADDVLISLTNPSELLVPLELLNLYSRASNAQLNKDKTVALSLSGKRQLPWITALNRAGINVWNDEHNTNPVMYLGYPLTHNKTQLNTFLNSTKEKIQHQVHILSQQSLSIQG